VSVTVSPGLGLPPEKSTVMLFGLAGGPLGPETVPPPVRLDVTPPSFRPNGEPTAFSAIATCEAPGDDIASRPSAPTPSACWRSLSTCLNPACVPLPSRICESEATGSLSGLMPEKM